MRLHPGPTGVCSVIGDRLWPSAPPDNPTPPSVEEDALPTPMISVSAAAEGTRASAAIHSCFKRQNSQSSRGLRHLGGRYGLLDCWTAELLFCDSVLLCCFPVVLGFGVCCALGFQGAISLFSWFCLADRFSTCSLTGTYTPIVFRLSFRMPMPYVGFERSQCIAGYWPRCRYSPAYCITAVFFNSVIQNRDCLPSQAHCD